MPKLSDFHPDDVEVDAPAPAAAAAPKMKLSDFHPDDVQVDSLPAATGLPTQQAPGLLSRMATQAKHDYVDPVTDGALPIASSIPIFGPLAEKGGNALAAGLAAGVYPRDKPFSQYYDEFTKKNEKSKADYEQKHPFGSQVAGLAGGATLPIAAPVFKTGLGNAASRVASNAIIQGTDAYARGGDAGEAAKTGGMVAGGIEAALRVPSAVGAAVPWVAKKAANYLGGVNEPNLEAYMGNSDRVNAAGAHSVEDIKNKVDAGVDQTASDAQAASARKQALYDDLEKKYAARKAELQGNTTPLDQAKQFSGSLEQQKSYLGSLSQQADDALERSGETFKKSDLIDAIDRVGAGQGKAIIGDEATAAIQKLDATKQRIIGGLPDEIDAKTMRDVLKQLRADIDFDGGSGEFNSTLNGMRKKFASSISGALKNASPEYSAYMDRMSGLSESLGKMNSHFGNDSKAIGSLEALRKGSSPQSKVIEDAMRQHAELNGDKGMLERLDKLRENQATLERMKTGDLRQEMFPKEFSAASDAAADAQMADDVHGGVKRLGRNSTQGAIRNQGGTVPSIENQKALENLKNTDGQNYQQLIDDKNVHDSFSKDATRGSRMAVIGGTTGGALGYQLGGASGAAIGASVGAHGGGLLDKYGGQVVKKGADVTLAIQKILDSSEGAKALGEFGATLKGAMQRGSIPITHALLMRNPKYRQIMEGDQQ